MDLRDVRNLSIDDLQLSAKWFAFATMADDPRRRRYQHALGRLRAADLRRRAQAASALDPPPLTIPEATGFVVDDQAALGDTRAMVQEVRRLAADLEPPDDGDAPKPYLHDYAVVDLDPGTPLAEFACRPSVVSIASAYLGLVPILSGIHIMRSPFVPGPVSGSQLFHCDWEDVRQVKVFVLCSDVDRSAGPLTAVSAAASARVKAQVGYRYGGAGFRLRDDQVLPLISDDDVHVFEGTAGGVTVIDTSSCLHYGSRVEPGAEPRLVVQFQYLTPTAFDLTLGSRRRPVLVRPGPRPSELERMLLGDGVRARRRSDGGQ